MISSLLFGLAAPTPTFPVVVNSEAVVVASVESPEILLPDEMIQLIEFMKKVKIFKGTNTEFAEEFNSFAVKKSLQKR